MRTAPVALSLAALALVSCGPAPVGKTLPRAAAPPAAHEYTWDKLSFTEKHAVMTFTVMPNVGRLVQKYEKTEWPAATCERCHGSDGEAKGYKLPNSLAPLDPAHLPDPHSKDPDEAQIATFMFDEVVPQMTALLDAKPYDPKTGEGFYCFNCHAKVTR